MRIQPNKICNKLHHEELKKQCCGAGAGGAEIIWGPDAGAENKFI